MAAAQTMRATRQSTCPATGRTITVGTLIFKSVLGWAIFDSESFAAVRSAVAEGRMAPVATSNHPAYRSEAWLSREIARDPDALSREMDREDSAY